MATRYYHLIASSLCRPDSGLMLGQAYLTKSGLMVFGFCPAGSTCKVDLTLGRKGMELGFGLCKTS